MKCRQCKGKKGNTTCNRCHGTGMVDPGEVQSMCDEPELGLQLVEVAPERQTPAWHPGLGAFPGFKQ